MRDAFGPLLPTLVADLGGEVAEVRYVPDHPSGLLADVVHEVGDADVLVVTGSTSVGTTDQLRELLDTGGARWIVDTVACRPGHPQLLAEVSAGRWLVGLPGNPFAALVAAHTLLAPLLIGLTGGRLPGLPMVPVTGDVRPAPKGTRLVLVVRSLLFGVIGFLVTVVAALPGRRPRWPGASDEATALTARCFRRRSAAAADRIYVVGCERSSQRARTSIATHPDVRVLPVQP